MAVETFSLASILIVRPLSFSSGGGGGPTCTGSVQFTGAVQPTPLRIQRVWLMLVHSMPLTLSCPGEREGGD